MVRIDDSHPTVFLIDFGLARFYRNPATYLHIPDSENQIIIGTLPFMSINSQKGRAQSCRDDLESLTYTIIYSTRGNLPWGSCATQSSRDSQKVLRSKSLIMVEKLCDGLPIPFREFVHHIHSLGFNEKPDYAYLHSILLQCSETKTDQPSDVPVHTLRPRK